MNDNQRRQRGGMMLLAAQLSPRRCICNTEIRSTAWRQRIQTVSLPVHTVAASHTSETFGEYH
jgi:hypothetical protein